MDPFDVSEEIGPLCRPLSQPATGHPRGPAHCKIRADPERSERKLRSKIGAPLLILVVGISGIRVGLRLKRIPAIRAPDARVKRATRGGCARPED
jgi:hypothetical protein